MPRATSRIPKMFLPITASACTAGFDPDQNFVLRLLLKWSAGIFTRINETIARFTTNVTTNSRTPMSALVHVRELTVSDNQSNIVDRSFRPLPCALQRATELNRGQSL